MIHIDRIVLESSGYSGERISFALAEMPRDGMQRFTYENLPLPPYVMRRYPELHEHLSFRLSDWHWIMTQVRNDAR